jgi:hypothetical protein
MAGSGVDCSFIWAHSGFLQHYDQSGEAPLEKQSPQRVVSHERDVESWENCTVSFLPTPRKPIDT